MINWKIAKCRYTKEFTDGTLKRVTEPYLISAMSITEAEARIYKEVGEYVRGEFLVTSIAGISIADIFEYDDSDEYYKAKVEYVSEDADSGKEKKVSNNYLVSANNLKEAYERIEESLKGLMVTFKITRLELSSIVDIFPYDPDAIPDTADKSEKEEIDSPNINVAYSGDEDE